MKKIENHCVGCPKDIGCIGTSCRYLDVIVAYCDECGSDNAEYEIDGQDYCADCAKEYLQYLFNSLPISERAERLEVYLKKIN